MYVENIFREKLNGEEFLYWYSIQGKGGQQVEESDSWVDKKHLQYWNECIDNTFITKDLKPSVIMIPNNVRHIMA